MSTEEERVYDPLLGKIITRLKKTAQQIQQECEEKDRASNRLRKSFARRARLTRKEQDKYKPRLLVNACHKVHPRSTRSNLLSRRPIRGWNPDGLHYATFAGRSGRPAGSRAMIISPCASEDAGSRTCRWRR